MHKIDLKSSIEWQLALGQLSVVALASVKS
jgi:hypothetical protein